MPTFFVLGHTQVADPALMKLDDLPGASGRWDVLARCVGAGLLVSHGVRTDSDVVLFLAGHDTYVRFEGRHARNLNPDERSTAALAAKALAVETVGEHEESVHPGVYVGRGTLAAVLDRIAHGREVVWLREQASTVNAMWAPEDVYILSDHRDLSPEEAHYLQERADKYRSLGDTILQADQAIVLVHDRILHS